MCTVVLLIRPRYVLLAANRDERIDRAWDPPAAWWPDRPGVIAGRDRSAGGTWMGLNRQGVAAAVLNRPGTLGPAAGKRSRGELPLIALGHPTAAEAAAAITRLDAAAWRPFNMVLADASGGWFIRGPGHGRPAARALPPGVSMVTAHDPNDLASPRVAMHLPRFRAAEPSAPTDWAGWRAILSDRSGAPDQQINVIPHAGFGTVCSSCLALPAGAPPLWLFAAGPPHISEFRSVFCGASGAAISGAPPQAVTT